MTKATLERRSIAKLVRYILKYCIHKFVLPAGTYGIIIKHQNFSYRITIVKIIHVKHEYKPQTISDITNKLVLFDNKLTGVL